MASPIFTNVQIIKRCHQILSDIEESIGNAIPDELAAYVTLTWGDILRGINHGEPIPSTAQLPHGDLNFPEERRVRLAMALFLPGLKEDVDRMSTDAQPFPVPTNTDNEIRERSTMNSFLEGAMREVQAGSKRPATSSAGPSRSKAARVVSTPYLPSPSASYVRTMSDAASSAGPSHKNGVRVSSSAHLPSSRGSSARAMTEAQSEIQATWSAMPSRSDEPWLSNSLSYMPSPMGSSTEAMPESQARRQAPLGRSTINSLLAGATVGGEDNDVDSDDEPIVSGRRATGRSTVTSALAGSWARGGDNDEDSDDEPIVSSRRRKPRAPKRTRVQSSPVSSQTLSLVPYNAKAQLPRIDGKKAHNKDWILENCPVLGLKSADALLALLAEPTIFDAFMEWRNDKSAEGNPPLGKVLIQAAVEELLRPSPKFSRDPIDKTGWDQQDHKLWYLVRVVRYNRLAGGIWENTTEKDFAAMVHASLALFTYMLIHSRQNRRAKNGSSNYKTIKSLYRENVGDENAGSDDEMDVDNTEVQENANVDNTEMRENTNVENTNMMEIIDLSHDVESEDEDPSYLPPGSDGLPRPMSQYFADGIPYQNGNQSSHGETKQITNVEESHTSNLEISKYENGKGDEENGGHGNGNAKTEKDDPNLCLFYQIQKY